MEETVDLLGTEPEFAEQGRPFPDLGSWEFLEVTVFQIDSSPFQDAHHLNVNAVIIVIIRDVVVAAGVCAEGQAGLLEGSAVI